LRKIASERCRSENHESSQEQSGITFLHGDFYEIPTETLKTQFDAKNNYMSFIVKSKTENLFSSKNYNDSREMDCAQLCAELRNFAFWLKNWRFHPLLDSTTMMRVKYQKQSVTVFGV
jgi:hypothetical protein